jgi:serine/threonine-protein kinase
MNVAVAVRNLGQHGYAADVRSRAVAGTDVGKVLSETPKAGTKLARGSHVVLVTGRGTRASGVPAVVGLPVDQAFVQLERAGLKGTTTRIASNRRPDTVLAQDPAPGARAQKGSTVSLKISKGGATQTVPRVVGLTEAAATAKLTGMGFQPRVSRVSSTKQSGLVISQDPAEGAKSARGATVGIDVSGGPPTTTQTGTTTTTPSSGATVTRVVGMGQGAAFLRLERAGFRVDSFPVASSQPRGMVVRQRPAGGVRAAPRSVVRIAVSLGSGPRPFRVVPDVSGMTEAAAKHLLVRVGFTVRALLPADDTTSDGDVVVDQKPSADARVRAGSQVAIYLGPPQ